MPEKSTRKYFSTKILWFLIIVSVISIILSFSKYYLAKDFILIDRIYCEENVTNCFAPDEEGGDPYKVLVFDAYTIPGCLEKDSSCDIENFCSNNSVGKCEILDCNDDLSMIPIGFTTSGECFVKDSNE